MPLPNHPFAVDVRRSRSGDNRFTWTIKLAGVIRDRSILDYESFEEARLALKAALNVQVVAWEAGR